MKYNFIEKVARAIAFSDLDEETIRAIDPEIFQVSPKYMEMAMASIREFKRFEFKEGDPKYISEYELTQKEAKSSLEYIVDIIFENKKPA